MWAQHAGGNDIFLITSDGGMASPVHWDNVGSEGNFDPAWSPDGDQIAFSNMQTSGQMHVYVGSASGGTATLLAFGDFESHRVPAWSPDGSQIAIASYNEGGTNRIWIAFANGEDEYQLMPETADRPSWSPTGSHLAFSSRRSGNSDIWITPVAGGAATTQITTDPSVDVDPDWSPDGSQIVFTSYRAEGSNYDIWSIELGVSAAPNVLGPPRVELYLRVLPNPSRGRTEIRTEQDLGVGDFDASIVGIDGRHLLGLAAPRGGAWSWDGKLGSRPASNGSYFVVLRRNGHLIGTERLVLAR